MLNSNQYEFVLELLDDNLNLFYKEFYQGIGSQKKV
jgi:hypothetical protein